MKKGSSWTLGKMLLGTITPGDQQIPGRYMYPVTDWLLLVRRGVRVVVSMSGLSRGGRSTIERDSST